MRNVEQKTSQSLELATVVTLLMFSLTVVPSMRLGHAQIQAVSCWLFNPITLDGAITSPSEWAESVGYDMSPLDRRWGWPDPQVEPSNKSLKAWFKNDEIWLYMLYQIPWPVAEADSTRDWGFILQGGSDSGWVKFQTTFDGYGFNGTEWSSDVEGGGQNNVEGAVSYDNMSYWFEFRKMLDSGDGLDWSLTPGESVDGLRVGVYDKSIESIYTYDVSLQLASNSLTLVSCSPNPISVGSPVTCTATVSGSNPTGTVSWSTSSSTGGFSQSVCTLFNGSCSTFYVDNCTGSVTITASYSGDSNNGPSSGSTLLTVFMDIMVGVNVTAYPTSGLGLTFPSVTVEGYVTADKTSTVEAPLLPDLVGEYYDIRVTATYSGKVMVSLAYDDTDMTQQQESSLQMMQYTPIQGDVLDYGRLNILDISFVAKCFGTTSASPGWDPAADITGDGNINIIDISTCAKNFGKTAEWTNITSYVDTELNIVHGETAHFSFIGIH